MSHVNPTPASPGALPPDERMRQYGLKIMMGIAATMRVGRAYAIGNQVFVRQLETLGAAITPVLEEHSEAVLVMHASDLYLNGVRLPVNQQSFKFQRTVIELFERLRIAGLRFVGGAPANELGQVFELVLKADGPSGSGLIEACGALGLTCVAPILCANVDPQRANGPAPSPEAPLSEDDRIAQQIYEPRIEALEVSGQRRLSQALQGTRLLLMPTSIQSVLEVRHAKRVVQPLVEGVSLSEPVVVGLTTLRQHDEFTYAHAVNVCGVAVAMGHFLGLDRRALSDLGVAALLHDVGKSAVADEITNDLENFTPEERGAAQRHPVEGAKLLAQSTSLNPTTLNCMRVALEHHAVGDGGYPVLPEGWQPGVLSQVIATADCYVSLQSRLSRSTPGLSPHEALGRMLGPLASRFTPALLWALVRAVGFYPAGQIVEMDDGCFGIVLAPDSEDMARPHVRVLMSWNGSALPPDRRIVYRPIPPERFIARALSVHEYPAGILELAEDAQAA